MPADPEDAPDLAALVQAALQTRLELRGDASDGTEDARRAASLAKQNLWPQLDLALGFTHYGLGPSSSGALRSRTAASKSPS